MSKGLYIHIPFCKYICSYCDFGKKYIKNQPVDEYLIALRKELEMYKPLIDIDSIYIGGGTPSSLSLEQLTNLLKFLKDSVECENIEFTFECNPDDVSEPLMRLLKNYGVTRISIGAQSLNNQILKTVNRKHTAEDVRKAVDISSKYIDNINVDFMFNLPTQTVADIADSIEFIKNNNLSHVSYYGLIFEEHTILSTQTYKYWSEDEESDVYKFLQTELAKLGFEQYEISNWCRAEKQSIHNIHYWLGDHYIGVGLSSSGYLQDVRYTNTNNIKQYIMDINENKYPIIERELLMKSDLLFEKIMLGLRYYQFVELGEELVGFIKQTKFLQDKFDYDVGRVRLKKEYYYISNQVILDIIERIEC